MTNMEKIRQFEVSGVRPFASLAAFEIADILGGISCKSCWHQCRLVETNCKYKMLHWLNKEAEE